MINFFAGPSQPYFTVQDHLRAAFRKDISTLSPRDKKYQFLFKETQEALRELLSVPSGFEIIFCSSTAEIRDRIACDLSTSATAVIQSGYEAAQLVSAFARRGHDVMELIPKNTDPGGLYDGVDGNSDLIAFAANERFEGTTTVPPSATSALVIGDISSCVPYYLIDYANVNSVFFSVTEGFGLPFSLGIWLVDEKCLSRTGVTTRNDFNSLERITPLAQEGRPYYDLSALDLYVLNGVVRDLARRTITTLRRETEYKAVLLYQLLHRHPVIKPRVSDRSRQSKTTLVAEAGPNKPDVLLELHKKGFYPGTLAEAADSRLIFANYPTHSKEQFELLVDALEVTAI